jgi:hypothetical protein
MLLNKIFDLMAQKYKTTLMHKGYWNYYQGCYEECVLKAGKIGRF